MAVFTDFSRQIREQHYWGKDETVIVGVSGGLDSRVLLDMLCQLPKEWKPDIHVAHVNHQLRKEAKEEEAFVRRLCADYRIPCTVHTWDSSLQPDTGIEEAARDMRYNFFVKLAKAHNSKIVMTAHHKNDQVETVLMRFVRGNSLDELTGIQSRRHSQGLDYIRPLLSFSKEDLEGYAREYNLTWYEDETNQSQEYTRNRFRHAVLPILRQENTAVDDHIAEFAEELSDVLRFLKPVVDEAISQTMVLFNKEIQIDRSAFIKLEPFIQKRVIEQAVKKWSGNEAFLIKRVHANLLQDWLQNSQPHSSLDLPNTLVAVREYNKCRITRREGTYLDKRDNEKNAEQYVLSPDQWIQLSTGEKIGLMTLKDYVSSTKVAADKVVYLDLTSKQLPLKVRRRKNGDRMSLKGMKGTRKVKAIFIDQKVPLKLRDKAWLITDKLGELLWLVGYKESALSLDPITDTISYVLVYRKLKSK